VQRVDDRHALDLPPAIAGFRTRRVNFTFRYVPDEHVVPFASLSPRARDDIRDYVATLARSSVFFAAAVAGERSGRTAAAR
jgi:DNA oxidative demethylase